MNRWLENYFVTYSSFHFNVLSIIFTVEIVNYQRRIEELEQKSSHLESELQKESQAKKNSDSENQEISQLRQELDETKSLLGDQKNDLSELHSKLSAKDSENANLKRDLSEALARLELSELNLTQLRSASQVTNEASTNQSVKKDDEISQLKAKLIEHEQREGELTAYIQKASQDREQIIHQYTAYSQQLTTQIESLSQNLQSKTKEIESLTDRERQLIGHVEQLEGQLQKVIQTEKEVKMVPSPASNVDHNELNMLRKNVAELDAKLSEVVIERDDLQGKLQEMVRN